MATNPKNDFFKKFGYSPTLIPLNKEKESRQKRRKNDSFHHNSVKERRRKNILTINSPNVSLYSVYVKTFFRLSDIPV